MSNPFAVHYVFRPTNKPGHYDEALFVGDSVVPYVQLESTRNYSSAVLENTPLVDEYDPDFVNAMPRPSGLVVAQVSFQTGRLNKIRRA